MEVNVAIEGCSHGELDVIYATLLRAEEMSGIKPDLLICCGDFQSVRNPKDLRCMAVPTKYMNMQSFYKYYSGEKIAPYLTIFIGGNHEASNYLQELPYGGWVAPNIYYLGYGGVINVAGLRIGGVSGIYKGPDYLKGRYERPPYTDSSVRSVYHVRNLEVFRMKQLDRSTPLDMFLSHDWPRGVTKYGDAEALCRQKKFFREEVESDTLGSRAAQELLHYMRPRFWFSGHLHVKFPALVGHTDKDLEALEAVNGKNVTKSEPSVEDAKGKIVAFTKFLALDKCLPRREFLQLVKVKPGQRHKYQNGVFNRSNTTDSKLKEDCTYDIYDKSGKVQLYHDLEWLTILRLTNHLQKTTSNAVYMPGPRGEEQHQFTPTEADLQETLKLMNNNLCISADKFSRTAPAYDPVADALALQHIESVVQPGPVLNPYTLELCDALGIDDPIALMLKVGKDPNKRRSFSMTPKRPPTAAEMNVTLDASKLAVVDAQGGSDEEGGSSGDIVFEVSITSSSDGASHGLLSPLNTSARRTGSGVRKALLLSTPIHSSGTDSQSDSASPPHSSTCGPEPKPDSSSLSVEDSPLAPASCSSSTGLDSSTAYSASEDPAPGCDPESSSQASDAGSCSDSSDQQQAVAVTSVRQPLVLSAPTHTGASDDCSPTSNINQGSDINFSTGISPRTDISPSTNISPIINISPSINISTSPNTSLNSPSPKRLLNECDGELDAATAAAACAKPPQSDALLPVQSSSKPSKIRRRNAAVYANTEDDE